jgi:hypothetical protein
MDKGVGGETSIMLAVCNAGPFPDVSRSATDNVPGGQVVRRVTGSGLVVGLLCILFLARWSAVGASATSKSPSESTTFARCISPAPCVRREHLVIPKPFRVSLAEQRRARTVLNGYSWAIIHRNVGRARSFLSPRSLWRGCNQDLGHPARYLRCLLDDTPLPLRFKIVYMEHETSQSNEITSLVTYYFHPPGHPGWWRYQPFYLSLQPGPPGLWIVGGGLPRG